MLLICLVFIPQKFLTKEAAILAMTLAAVEMKTMRRKMKRRQLEKVFILKIHALLYTLRKMGTTVLIFSVTIWH